MAEVSNDKTVAPQQGNDTKTISENTKPRSHPTEAGSDPTAISEPVPVTEKIAANTMVSLPNQANVVVNDQKIVDVDIIQRNIALYSRDHDIHSSTSSNHQIDKAPIVASILSGSSPEVHHVFEYAINPGPTGTGQKKNTEPNPGSNKIEGNENAGSSSMADYISYNHFLQDISLIVLAGIVFIGILGFYRRRESN